MKQKLVALAERGLDNWKTTCAGALAVAGVILSSLYQNYGAEKWILTGTAIVAGLTGILAKD